MSRTRLVRVWVDLYVTDRHPDNRALGIVSWQLQTIRTRLLPEKK